MAVIGEFDVLSLLVTYLSEETGVPVRTEVPEERPDVFVSVFRDGGVRSDIRFDRPRVTIWAWAKSETEAYSLVNAIRNAMAELPAKCVEVSSAAEQSTRVNNHSSGHRRYESTWSLMTTA